MIYEFVDKIVVHSPIKVDGEREQQVDIYLKFKRKRKTSARAEKRIINQEACRAQASFFVLRRMKYDK